MLNELKKSAIGKTTTENAGVAHLTTGSNLVNFFSQAGAMRNRSEEDIISLFDAAYADDKEKAFKLLFYFRDIRGGQGERRLFRVITKYLAKKEPEIIKKNLHLFSEYGRWDDLWILLDTELKNDIVKLVESQLSEDIDNYCDDKSISLLAKWLPSENASSKETKRLARIFIKELGYKPKLYREVLSDLREHLKVVETKMSDKEWSEIDYCSVPSKASMIYRNAFLRHDKERYTQFLDDVRSGKEEIKASTLYPTDIVDKILYDNEENDTLEALWDNLPNFIKDDSNNSIVVADVSGSMRGKPLATSIGLAIYFSERNAGEYANHFITFSGRPTLQTVSGTTITQKVRNLSQADWEMNTNIKAVFDLILQTAIDNDVTQENMIDNIYIISDMEFDYCTGDFNDTVMDTIRKSYKDNDYEIPNLVFWNVNARNKQYPEQHDVEGVQLISGYSPSILKFAVNNPNIQTIEIIDDIVTDKRYSQIVI